MIREKIEEKIKKTFKSEFNLKLNKIELINPEPQFGDFALACHSFAKELKMPQQDIALKLAESLKDKLIVKADAKGGYLNITINSSDLFKEVLSEIFKKEDKYGESNRIKQKIVIEYSSPNTNKPLHLGHIRNNVLGMSFARMLESQGADVKKVQLINDKGVHIMKSLVAYQKNGDNKTPESEHQKGDHFVGKYYVQFDENTMTQDAKKALIKWEQGDKEINDLWKKMNKWVYDGFSETYKTLGSEFEKTYFESNIYRLGKQIIQEGLKKGVFKKEKDNSISINLEDVGLDKKILQRSDQTSVYITQDLALAVARQNEYKADSLVYVVGHEQEYHFKVLFEILKRLGYSWANNLHHLSYGLVFLPEGKMKSREGKVVDADDIISEVQDLAAQEIKKRFSDINDAELGKRAEAIGMSALKFMLLKITPSQSIYFNPKEAISFEGSTGPYVQYAHARISSILKNQDLEDIGDIDFELLREKEERELVLKLMQYSKVVQDATENYNPSSICNYLLELSRLFNTFYHKHHVLKAENENIKNTRLVFVRAVQFVLKNGLNMLGITALNKM